MFYGKRRKWLHFRDPKLKNFLEKNATRTPYFSFHVYIFTISRYAPESVFSAEEKIYFLIKDCCTWPYFEEARGNTEIAYATKTKKKRRESQITD